jgi:dihydrofolate synthase/folylpolyglutamate synthase
VGLFTSPHLIRFGERIQVNRKMIADADVVRLVNEMRPLLAQFEKEHHPTFFEVVTVMALRYFAAQKCDLVIWETGLGGRLDATNIVLPLASVITTIQYDHEKWLGDTLASIASEKAGIIKPGVPVVTGVADPEPLAVIQDIAARHSAPLHCVDPSAPEPDLLKRITLSLHGAHQRTNAAVAIRTVQVLQPFLPTHDSAIADGLQSVYWPGRLQQVRRQNGQVVLLDAAHNPGGAETLARALRTEFRDRKICLILGILQDKNYCAMCGVLAPLAARILLVPVHSERAASTSDLASACRKFKPDLTVVQCPSLPEAMKLTCLDETVVIAGSLYLTGEAMELLGISPGAPPIERRLNEWTQKA